MHRYQESLVEESSWFEDLEIGSLVLVKIVGPEAFHSSFDDD